MRVSGRDSDLTVIFVPLVILVAVGVALAGDPAKVFGAAERTLWQIVNGIGAWLAGLFS